MNISFITAFRKFKKPFDTIQHSALYSWRANGIKVFVPINEIGVREACAAYDNVTLIDGVKRGRELGFETQSPIVSDLIAKALPYIDTTMVAYINSDIIITDKFAEDFQRTIDKYGFDIYAVGSRKDIELKELVNTPETYQKVLNLPRAIYDVSTSSDIFIASKFTWRKIISEMPEYILGRWAWDNYLHFMGIKHKTNKFNCTDALPILHCKHDFNHIFVQEKSKAKQAPSSKHNLALWKQVLDASGTPRINNWPRIEL